jgi:phosphoglucosamine mutase
MTRKYFGTDGIRGKANSALMSPEIALRLALAAGRKFAGASEQPVVVIGRDTRQSGGMIEAALFAGFTSAGYHVQRAGVLPTPAVAMLTRQIGANLGVMISASHNLYQDNGLKLFKADGTKLSEADEVELEAMIDTAFETQGVDASKIGFITPLPDASAHYANSLLLGSGIDSLEGIKVVLDCANGAALTTAPGIFKHLKADVTFIGTAPDGKNINDGVGSTSTAALKAAVLEQKAAIGIALDGDADRLIIIDETGAEIDGDQIIALIASQLHAKGQLKGGGVVATIMSNMGLEQYLKTKGLHLVRTPVGDKHVAEHMRTEGYNVGGEPSGHIILSDTSTTGDGTLAALQILSVLKESGAKMSTLGHQFTPAPQKLVNLRYATLNPLETPPVQKALKEAEAFLGEKGRMVVRTSGTEPLVRIMAEALDEEMMTRALAHVSKAVEAALA